MGSPLVLIDADVLGRQRTGDESYVENLLRELPALAPDLRIAAVTRHPERLPAGVEPLELTARSQLARMSLGLPRLLRRLRPDLAHFQYVVPAGAPATSVVTVHDLSFERHPELMGRRDRLLFRTFVPRSARRAARVLAVSEHTKRDLLERYRLDERHVVVTPNGVDPIFSPEGALPGEVGYLLFVGTLNPRKDPVAALEALALLGDDRRLLLAGPARHGAGEAHRAVARLGLEARVRFLGHVEKDELAALYRGAACLVFPSRYEGFGLPLLEAMASGTPVVATRAGAIPEVAGDAAVLVESGDAAALAAGIERALSEREQLVPAGLARARRFSWRATAERTLAVYRELL